MRRILVRGGVNPLAPLATNSIIAHNKIGGNSGNVLYLMGVLRSLYTEDVDIDMDGYAGEGGRYSQTDIDRINNEYDAYIIPLADAFRPDFCKSLINLTNFIKSLSIPCHVLSVGIRAPYEPNFNDKFSFDDAVKEFIKSVLDKSSLVGLRGEITATYLEKLGFIAEKDFTIIGCPSMYIFGKRLARRKLSLDVHSRISINFNPNIPDIDENIRNLAEKYREWYYYEIIRRWTEYNNIREKKLAKK